MNKTKLTADLLIPMDQFEKGDPVRVDIAYARDDNLLFGQRIYSKNARLWLHRDLAEIVCAASRAIHKKYGYYCMLYDGLRTVDAQEAMLITQRVQDNPDWLEEPNRLLSPPGAGAHPRGMAIDIALEDASGRPLDMGTPFDDLSERAHRDYPHTEDVQDNRAVLCDAMMQAARALGRPLLPLPAEWWDFRFPPDVYESYAPLSDSDLPDDMRMMG